MFSTSAHLALVIAVGAFTWPVHLTAFSTGAPDEGCWNKRPLHGDYLPQGGPTVPFRILTNATSYSPGDSVVVRLVANGETRLRHKGFLLQMESSGGRSGGLWAIDPRRHRYNAECGVTHNNPRSRSTTVVLWRAPSAGKGHLGRIQFRTVAGVYHNHNVHGRPHHRHRLFPTFPDQSSSSFARDYDQVLSLLSDKPANQSQGTSSQETIATSGLPMTSPSPLTSGDLQMANDLGTTSATSQSSTRNTTSPVAS